MSDTTSKKRFPAVSIIAGLVIAAVLGFYAFDAAKANGETSNDDSAEAAEDGEEKDSEDKDDEGEDGEEKKKTPIPVEAAATLSGRISSYISATANLVPESEVRILAEWEGRLAKLNVEEGDRIKKGQVLAELARQDGEITLNKAKLKESTSRLAYERAERLKAQELISPEEFDKIALDHEIAGQELAEAEWKHEKTLIRSPFTGRVTERMVQPGQHVRPGDELFTVADFDPLIARIFLPERDVLTLDEGRGVRIALRADAGIEFDGRIRQISPVVDTATGTVKITVEARSVPAAVRPGAFVRIDIVRDSIADAVLMPREAVIRELQNAYVFVATDGHAEKRTVTLGLEEEDHIQAVSGVEEGEQVIVAGQGGLKDGSVVKLMGAEAEAEAGEEPAEATVS
ncbi:MAG: efflux RND transporter periplasmic adaptor subunit [bacterium]|nr:efflux RND transporter periplasmic adaptor subunit [bacterium]